MPENDEQIERLQTRLDKMVEYQDYFFREINSIREEIGKLKASRKIQNTLSTPESLKKPIAREDVSFYKPPQPKQPVQETVSADAAAQPAAKPVFQNQSDKNRQTSSPNFNVSAPEFKSDKSDLEKFIGENLISKIGIVILILGVAIGAKYAIDNDLISPLTRIVLGYAFGFGLLGFAVKLKAKYLNFSAVLMSGAMAIMYFITYFAYALYALFSQSTAFVLMLVFTVFTVVAAVNYSRQVIAHIGLVGAYAIPFLLSDNSGNYAFLFGFIAIVNCGILAICVKKYWKSLYYSSFAVTWLIFSGWYLSKYRADENFNLALLFLTINFLTFYLTFLAYKLISKQSAGIENVVLILANSFVFYGLGYSILESRANFHGYLGLFTVINAAIHCAFAFAVSRLKNIAPDLIYLLGALVLTFATIAVPVQFDGNFITLIWTAEAAILFWVGRTRQVSLYENYSYPLMILSSVSLLNNWQILYERYFTNDSFLPAFFNPFFAVGLFFVAAFAFINFIDRDKNHAPNASPQLAKITKFALPAIFLIAFYNVFRVEIANYFHYKTLQTAVGEGVNVVTFNDDLSLYNYVWQINYTMLFLSLLSFANIKKFRSFSLGFVNLALNALILLVFISGGLYFLGELRTSYLTTAISGTVQKTVFNILIRYVSYAFAGALIYAIYKYFKQDFIREKVSRRDAAYFFDFIFYFSMLCISSGELLNWMDIFGYNESYKLGLSILWGIYALLLIVVGIYQNKKHLRVGAIALFGLTLAKIFFYDIAELDTISKTVVFISLGVLMLIVSFLYNKYKHLIFDARANEDGAVEN